jgi:uncharacterized protein (TIGR02246 family)
MTKRIFVTIPAFAAVLGICIAANVAVAQRNAAAEIEGVTEQYRQAWQRGDIDRVMQFWTPEAKVIGPGFMAAGTAAIRASLERSVSMGIYDLRHEDREVYGSGDTVVEITRSMLYDHSGKAVVAIRYMTLWQKSEGQWRIHRELCIPIGAPQQP